MWLIVFQMMILVVAASISLHLYSPILLKIHWLSFTIVSLISLTIALIQSRFNFLQLAALATLSLTIYIEASFYYQRHVVLNSPLEVRQQLSQHIILGFKHYNEVKQLIDDGLLKGVFLTRRNIQGLSLSQVQSLTHDLRNLPLRWLATDQEGGLVQRLSPPLPRQQALHKVVTQAGEEWQTVVKQYAQQQGHHLAQLGVNLNFAPVVDLPPQATFWDQHSLISARVIADDATKITQVGQAYSTVLLETGVLPCLKHFPGLGDIHTDTHFFSAELTTPIADLQAKDWQPFQQISQQLPVAIMLGHIKLTELDQHYPASFSPTVIQFLRDEWQYQGLLITDDFSMFPISANRLGVGKVALQALNSGVDLILIAYDYRLFYPMMYQLIRAHQDGRLDLNQLQRSQDRQQRILGILDNRVDEKKGLNDSS
ncbi:glycoside hydrolase family 3 N-terminal domain-containing protein [Candidatus Albibeggiatoa sp. nov. NOAA]|uniref:glycoside hydrolase family 3 N-terminal domain-containing protein n=1 Tax=Candidatus Albibeggiatoa sp. nov. NOAA TaxID=3162724 RepID=UPI0033024C24|nr:hypothetical protein [Thiotrichaceae bacterium]